MELPTLVCLQRSLRQADVQARAHSTRSCLTGRGPGRGIAVLRGLPTSAGQTLGGITGEAGIARISRPMCQPRFRSGYFLNPLAVPMPKGV